MEFTKNTPRDEQEKSSWRRERGDKFGGSSERATQDPRRYARDSHLSERMKSSLATMAVSATAGEIWVPGRVRLVHPLDLTLNRAQIWSVPSRVFMKPPACRIVVAPETTVTPAWYAFLGPRASSMRRGKPRLHASPTQSVSLAQLTPNSVCIAHPLTRPNVRISNSIVCVFIVCVLRLSLVCLSVRGVSSPSASAHEQTLVLHERVPRTAYPHDGRRRRDGTKGMILWRRNPSC